MTLKDSKRLHQTKYNNSLIKISYSLSAVIFAALANHWLFIAINLRVQMPMESAYLHWFSLPAYPG